MSLLNGQTILIAEDEPFMRSVLETTLRREGALVIAVENGGDALAILNGQDVGNHTARHVDIALLDFMMPKAHGIYILKQLRTAKTAHPAGLPVGMLTSASDSRTVAMSIRLDCDAFIVKPLNKQVLIERMNRLVDRRNRQVRTPVFYEAVDVGKPEEFDPDAFHAPGSEDTTVVVGAIIVPLSAVQVGMVFAEDLTLYKGAVIVPKGCAVNDELLMVLQDLDRIVPNLSAMISP